MADGRRQFIEPSLSFRENYGILIGNIPKIFLSKKWLIPGSVQNRVFASPTSIYSARFFNSCGCKLPSFAVDTSPKLSSSTDANTPSILPSKNLAVSTVQTSSLSQKISNGCSYPSVASSIFLAATSFEIKKPFHKQDSRRFFLARHNIRFSYHSNFFISEKLLNF